jgi:peptidoglycan/xylan/chitin deacetylase (PgdA/CDA1 family)
VWAGLLELEAFVSLLGRREGLPSRTVLIPVGPRHTRMAGLRRALVVLAGVLVLALAGAIAVAILRGSRSEHVSAPPRTAPTPVRPSPRRPTRSAAALAAAAQQRAITRLSGLGVPVFCGAPRGNELALTFDDGPGPHTAKVLAILRRFHAQATFFLVGNRIRFWPGRPAAEARLGAVGDHTWSHADLARLSRPAAAAEVDRGRAAIVAAARTPVRLFRIPYGHDPAWLGRYLATRGMLEIRWSVESRDYLPGSTATRIVRRVGPGLRPGAIVLLHDIHAATVRALPRLLALIKARHLRAVSIPELLRSDAPTYPQLMADNRGRGCVDLATARRE